MFQRLPRRTDVRLAITFPHFVLVIICLLFYIRYALVLTVYQSKSITFLLLENAENTEKRTYKEILL